MLQAMKAISITMLLLLVFTQSSRAGLFDLASRDLPYAAPDVDFISDSKTHSLAQYKGRKVMLWLFSTWCHTCVAGVKVMQKNQAIWKQTGLTVLAIRNHNNGGYPGLEMPAFIKKIAPQLGNETNWVIGEATAAMDQKLNGKKFPDIYFLIDENGMIQKVSTAPPTTIKQIIKFARGEFR